MGADGGYPTERLRSSCRYFLAGDVPSLQWETAKCATPDFEFRRWIVRSAHDV